MVSLRPLAALPVVGVVADGRTYRHLLYLLIAVPLGFFYSGTGSFALVFGVLLSVVLVGVGLLIAAVVGSRLVAGLERWLANRLLGTELAAPDDLPAAAADGDAGAVATVRAYLTAPSTWRGLGFISLKFWVTVAAVAPLAVLANALPLITAPLRYPYETTLGEVNGEPAVWAIDTAPEAALAAGLGVVGVLVGLHLTNLIAGGARLMAVALLGDGAESADPESDDGASDDGASDDGGESDGGESDGARVTVDREPEAEERAAVDESADPVDESADPVDESSDPDESDADGFEFGGDPADSGEHHEDADPDDARRGDRD
jgi:hypothetical protein